MTGGDADENMACRMTDLVLTPAFVEHHPLDDARKAFMVVNHTNHLLLELIFICSKCAFMTCMLQAYLNAGNNVLQHVA